MFTEEVPTDGRQTGAAALAIGLVNCAAPSARPSTERQFRELVAAAAGARAVVVRPVLLPEPGESPWTGNIDGFIVTGMEPVAATLSQEPCWPGLQWIADWAEAGGVPVIWSCLAAHAAVLHLSGVHRRRREQKLSGLFDCCKAGEHPLLTGLPSRWCLPHSRWNELDEAELAAHGYQVISRSDEAGIDMFVLERNSLSLFVQGHPEYRSHTLLMEYRRDITRFLTGTWNDYPTMPRHYFNDSARTALTVFQGRAVASRQLDIIGEFPMAVATGGLLQPWHSTAIGLYRNWLALVADRKRRRLGRCTRSPSRHPAELVRAGL